MKLIVYYYLQIKALRLIYIYMNRIKNIVLQNKEE
jgi:hypothetical protein